MTAAACTDESDDPVDTSENTQSVTTANSLSYNRIATNRIATNRIATNRIATNRLSNGNLALDEDQAGDLLTTPEGRELLTYVVGCALTKTQTLEGSANGVTYTFTGDIGLARTWVNHALTMKDQHWVSACLLARVNAHDISLLVSLRGPNSHLTTGAQEALDYTVEEGSFYGNVFLPIEEPIIAYSCRGYDQAMGEPASGASPLGDRDCAEPSETDPTKSQCDFAFVGNCAAFDLSGADPGDGDDDDDDHGHGHGYGHCNHGHHGWGSHEDSDPHACETQVSDAQGGYYKKCYSEASNSHGRFPHDADRFKEVITVYLAP